MTNQQALFLADWQEHQDRIQAEAREVLQKAEEVQNRGEQLAYSEITRAADRLVQKAGRLTREQAVARVLEQRPELYDAYTSEHTLRLHMAEVTDRNWRRKVNKAEEDRERHEKLLDAIARPAGWAQ
jgi:hypothetical protein